MMNQSPIETALSRAMIRWSLTKSAPVTETSRSWIFRVEQNGNAPAGIKIFKPEALLAESRGSRLLQWYGGEGAVTVFDLHENTLFMEWIEGATTGASALGGSDAASATAFAEMVAKLHRPREEPLEELETLRQRFQALFDTDMRAWPHTARDLYARSTGIALKLFDTPSPQTVLHGHLHGNNIVVGPRSWRAIDPTGMLGDPAYDLASFFLLAERAANGVIDPRQILICLDSLTQHVDYARKRILGWAAAQMALSACQDLAQGQPIVGQLALLPTLLSAYDRA